MKLKINHTRSGLHEGRTSGMAFGFIKKIDDESFETVMPISTCKDYLNEVVYAEHTNKIAPKIYGFKYEQVNNLFEEDYTYLAIYFTQTDSTFGTRIDTISQLMTELNEYVGLGEMVTTITQVDELEVDHEHNPVFIVKFPIFWTSKIYLISLFTLFLRANQNYDSRISFDSLINGENFEKQDVYLMQKALPKLKLIAEGKIPEQKLTKSLPSTKIHDEFGIYNYKFDEVQTIEEVTV